MGWEELIRVGSLLLTIVIKLEFELNAILVIFRQRKIISEIVE